MTATMIATLVAEGKLHWNTKLIEAIPELGKKIHTDYHKITLWQLLTHRAGLPKNVSDEAHSAQKKSKQGDWQFWKIIYRHLQAMRLKLSIIRTLDI